MTGPLGFDPIEEARRQWKAHSWDEPEAMAAVTSVMRAQQLLLAAIDAALRPFELTFARYEVLVLLSFTRTGALPLGKVGERLQVHPTSVTSAVDKLEAQGFVRRDPHPSDRRTTLAAITPAGRAVVAKATPALTDIRFGADGLGQRKLQQLTALLRELRASAGDFDLQ